MVMMKRFIYPLFIALLLFSCGGSPETGQVVLDGPVLEGINTGGRLEFNGILTNVGSMPVRSVHIVIILKDDEGKTIEVISQSVLGDDPGIMLEPSQSTFFEVSAASNPKRVASKEIEVYYEEVSESPGES